MRTAAKIRAIGLAIERYRPRFDALGIDADRVLLETLWREDAEQQPKGKFGNKRPGIPCGKGYISWRKKCRDKGKVAIAKERLKGTAEGKAYADRIRKFKGLEKANRRRFKGFAAGNQFTEKWSAAWDPKMMPSHLIDAIKLASVPQEVKQKYGGRSDGMDSAYYSSAQVGIHMAAERKSDRALAVYRHEFGHHIDAEIKKERRNQSVMDQLAERRKTDPGVPLTTEDWQEMGRKANEKVGAEWFISDTPDAKAAREMDNALLVAKKLTATKKMREDHIKEFGESRSRTIADTALVDDIGYELIRAVKPGEIPGIKDLDAAAKKFKSPAAKAAWTLAKKNIGGGGNAGHIRLTKQRQAWRDIAVYDKYRDPSLLVKVVERKIEKDDKGQLIGGLVDDLTGSISRNQIGNGHSNEYYDTHKGGQEHEAFANYVALSTAGPKMRAIGQELAPTFFKFGDKVVKEYVKARQA
jgi:hypothetical protein